MEGAAARRCARLLAGKLLCSPSSVPIARMRGHCSPTSVPHRSSLPSLSFRRSQDRPPAAIAVTIARRRVSRSVVLLLVGWGCPQHEAARWMEMPTGQGFLLLTSCCCCPQLLLHKAYLCFIGAVAPHWSCCMECPRCMLPMKCFISTSANRLGFLKLEDNSAL
ncbi:hypothetical protein Dimus_008854 [Dionaea muscipula]